MWLIILFVISFIRWHLVKNFLFLSGLLLLVLLTFTLLVCRRRRRHLKKLKSEKKRQREAEREMELKTRSCRHSGYRLAFDNPYYDVSKRITSIRSVIWTVLWATRKARVLWVVPPNAVYRKARVCSPFRTAEFRRIAPEDDVIVDMMKLYWTITSLLRCHCVIVVTWSHE